jgi:GR25 family glycosyltransferase involved in LPS biosynthesis
MKLPFDKIYCLHLAEAKERYDSVLEECEKINLENEIDFWYTTKKPINATIGNNTPSLHIPYYDIIFDNNKYLYGACFDCAYNHYSIVKQAYIRGFNSILIFEDDIEFNDDIDLLNTIIENIPNDYDVIKFINTEIYHKKFQIKHIGYFRLINEKNNFLYSTLCYALSRKGMKVLIDEYESNFTCADIVLDNIRSNDDIKFYSLKLNMFCNPKSKFESTINN